MKLATLKRRYFTLIALFWFSTILPASISILLAQSRGLNLQDIGIVLGVYSLVIVLFEVPSGALADVIGRKRITLLALLVLAAAQSLLLFAFTFPAFLIWAALSGLGRALFSGSPEAWFVDALKDNHGEDKVQPALAQANSIELTALATGTLLGGFLPELFTNLPTADTVALSRLSSPVLASAIGFSITFVACLFLLPQYNPSTEESTEEQTPGLLTTLRSASRLTRSNPTILVLLIPAAVTGLAISSLETFWQPFFATIVADAETKTWLFGVLLAGSFGAAVIGNLLSTFFSERLEGNLPLLSSISLVLQGICLTILAFQTKLLVGGAFFWLVYLSHALRSSPHKTLLNEQISSSNRSVILSVESLAFFLGGLLGSTGLGFIAERVGLQTGWWLVAGILLLTSLAYVQIARLRQ